MSVRTRECKDGTIEVAILIGVHLCSDDKYVRSRSVIVRRHDIDIVSCKLYWAGGEQQQCQLDQGQGTRCKVVLVMFTLY